MHQPEVTKKAVTHAWSLSISVHVKEAGHNIRIGTREDLSGSCFCMLEISELCFEVHYNHKIYKSGIKCGFLMT